VTEATGDRVDAGVQLAERIVRGSRQIS
jgi:hypothetical protein